MTERNRNLLVIAGVAIAVVFLLMRRPTPTNQAQPAGSVSAILLGQSGATTSPLQRLLRGRV